jgi:hypothetical protein
MLTYVYCLVRSTRRPALRDVPAPMPGATAVRAVDAGGSLWLIVSSVAPRDYDEAALARGLQKLDWVGPRAVAHEAVVEYFLAAPAVLPMQLFTLFRSDDRAVEHVTRDRPRIDRIVARIERQVEWGLRLTFDENAARQAVEEKHVLSGASRTTRLARTRGPAAGRVEMASGVAYLARKRDLRDITGVQLLKAKADADRLYRAMAREAVDARRRSATEQAAPGSRLLVDAAFLVPRRRAGAFRAALRKNARQLAATGIVVSLTGPWPPYNFIDPSSPVRKARKSARPAARRQASRVAPRAPSVPLRVRGPRK